MILGVLMLAALHPHFILSKRRFGFGKLLKMNARFRGPFPRVRVLDFVYEALKRLETDRIRRMCVEWLVAQIR